MKCVSVRSDLAIDTKIDGGAARYTRGQGGGGGGHRALYIRDNFEQTLNFVLLTSNRDASTRATQSLGTEGKKRRATLLPPFSPNFQTLSRYTLAKVSLRRRLRNCRLDDRCSFFDPKVSCGQRKRDPPFDGKSPIIGHEKGQIRLQQRNNSVNPEGCV